MQIISYSPYFNFSSCRTITKKAEKAETAEKAKKTQSINFTSIFPDAGGRAREFYSIMAAFNPEIAKLQENITRAFRELPSEIAVTKLLNPDEKTQIKVFGCADGSEAFSYAVCVKEELKENAKNVTVQGVDLHQGLIDTAKSGRMVMSDIEKYYALGVCRFPKRGTPVLIEEGDKSPIAGEGWDRHLIKSSRPGNFEQIVKKHPELHYLENDPAARKSIGNGLEWYEVNKEGLPEITFECADMRDCLEPDKEAQNVVYVIANTSYWLLEEGADKYIKFLSDIKEHSKDKKDVYVVIGRVEHKLLNTENETLTVQEREQIKKALFALGFRQADKDLTAGFGIKNPEETAQKIYKLCR